MDISKLPFTYGNKKGNKYLKTEYKTYIWSFMLTISTYVDCNKMMKNRIYSL